MLSAVRHGFRMGMPDRCLGDVGRGLCDATLRKVGHREIKVRHWKPACANSRPYVPQYPRQLINHHGAMTMDTQVIDHPETMSASAAAQAIREGRLTSEALTRACLERIAARDPVVKAWSFVDPALALR